MLEFNFTLLVQLAIFLAVMVSLNFLIFRPLARLHKRREAIFGQLGDDVSLLETTRQDRESAYNTRLEDVKKEVLAFKASLKEKIDSESQAIINRAQENAEGLLEKEEDELAGEVIAARQFLRSQTQAMAALIFTKMLGREVESKL